MTMEKITLEGQRVRMEPLSVDHLPGLAESIRDGELWKLPVTIVPHPSDLEEFHNAAQTAFAAGREQAFAIIDKATGRVTGSTRFRSYEAAHKRVEIGFSFLGEAWQRTHVNTEAKYLMLKHAFEHLHLNRVELLTDMLNLPSRKAIGRLGAKEEGILRAHMVMRDGRIRDSVIFSITRADWPRVAQELATKVAEGSPPAAH